MGKNLTKRQREILDFITEFIETNNFAPSLREIGDNFHLSSPATIHAHIDNLKRKGFLKSNFNEARSIELAPVKINLAQAIELPLAGLITAGEPIEAVETSEAIAVPADLIGDEANSYVLKVKGESMIEEGITQAASLHLGVSTLNILESMGHAYFSPLRLKEDITDYSEQIQPQMAVKAF